MPIKDNQEIPARIYSHATSEVSTRSFLSSPLLSSTPATGNWRKKMETVKFVAQDILEYITGHPSNIKKKPSSRPTVRRLSLDEGDLTPVKAKKNPKAPASAPPVAGAKVAKKDVKPGGAKGSPIGKVKGGDTGKVKDKEKEAEDAVKKAKLALQKAKDEEAKKRAARKKAKEAVVEIEKEKATSSGMNGGDSAQKSNSSKTNRSGSTSTKKPSSGSITQEKGASQKQVTVVRASKTAMPTGPAKSKTDRKIKGIPKEDDDGSHTVVPKTTGSSSKFLSSRSASRTQPLQDATIPAQKTALGRQLGDNARTVLDGMQTPSVISAWQKSAGNPSKAAPTSKSRYLPKDLTILPDKTKMGRQLGDNNRTVVEGMQTSSILRKWQEEEEEARDPRLLPDPRSEQDRQLGDMNRTVVEGMVTASRMRELMKEEKKAGKKK